MIDIRGAILASGNGSNAEALIQQAQKLPGVSIDFVFTDNPQAPVIQRMEKGDVPVIVSPRLGSKEDHEHGLLKLIDDHQTDWIFLAGYMKILSAGFVRTLKDRHQGASQIVNVHPSLLPSYPGINSLARAYADRAPLGVTLHLVDEGVDTGPILDQKQITALVDEDLSSLAERTHKLEHQMYCDFLQHLHLGLYPTFKFKKGVIWPAIV